MYYENKENDSLMYYGNSFSYGVKIGCEYDIPSEQVTIIANSRFESFNEAIQEYGPDGTKEWGNKEIEYAQKIWDAGQIIQPRELMHIGDDNESFVGGAAELGSPSDRNIRFSGGGAELVNDVMYICRDDHDMKLLSKLQELDAFPKFRNDEGQVINVDDYLQTIENKPMISYRYNHQAIFKFDGSSIDGFKEANVPEGITKVEIKDCNLVLLPDSVQKINLDCVDMCVVNNASDKIIKISADGPVDVVSHVEYLSHYKESYDAVKYILEANKDSASKTELDALSIAMQEDEKEAMINAVYLNKELSNSLDM